MILTQEDAFLADICEHPEDNAPRLIYADWLEEQPGPDAAARRARAEFIRAQVEKARLPAGHPDDALLARRQDTLLAQHEPAWRAGLPDLPGVSWLDFTRGFVEAVFVENADVFLAAAPAIFAAAPVRRVQVGWLDDRAARRLAGSAHLARLAELNLGHNTQLRRAGVSALADSPHLAGLSVLLMHYSGLGDEPVLALARSPHLGRLKELYLSGNHLSDAAAVALAESTTLGRLAELDLRDNRIADTGAAALASTPGLGALLTLWLVNNQIGAFGAAALAVSGRLPRLAQLYLNYNPVGDEGALAFADTDQRRALVDLDLRRCLIRDAGGRALANPAGLGGVQMLWLGGNRLRMETLTLLRRRWGMRLRL